MERQHHTDPVPIGDVAVTSRALADYRQMFLLSDDELRAGPILDCPAGTSPFGAQARARGGTVVSVDPAYEQDREELLNRSRSDIQRATAWVTANPQLVDWEHVGTPDAMRRAYELALDLFAADFALDGDRYVAAALPRLPFTDDSFRLALSSHLLFVYPQHLDLDAHEAAIQELVRVTHGEVRIYPLVDTLAQPYPHLDALLERLAQHGIVSELRRAECAWQPGGNRQLVCRPPNGKHMTARRPARSAGTPEALRSSQIATCGGPARPIREPRWRAALLDETNLQLVPAPLAPGRRRFEDLPLDHVEPALLRALDAQGALRPSSRVRSAG
jgi:hypothetical protein